MIKYLQSFLLSLGDYGCYVFCIINIAEEYLKEKFSYSQVFDFIEQGIAKGYIDFDWGNYKNTDNFYVVRPDAFLSMMINKKCTIRKCAASYKPLENEYIVERWANNGYAHFARTANKYNSLQHSVCVEKGKIESTRVFTIN